MRKLAALVVLGAGCAIGFPCPATAADVVNILCLSHARTIFSSQASAGVEVPSSCTPNSPSCAQCDEDLRSQGFTRGNPTPASDTTFTEYTFTRRTAADVLGLE